MDSNNIYSLCIAFQNGPRGQGKDGEKGMCKIAMLDRNVEEHYQDLKADEQQLNHLFTWKVPTGEQVVY